MIIFWLISQHNYDMLHDILHMIRAVPQISLIKQSFFGLGASRTNFGLPERSGQTLAVAEIDELIGYHRMAHKF